MKSVYPFPFFYHQWAHLTTKYLLIEVPFQHPFDVHKLFKDVVLTSKQSTVFRGSSRRFQTISASIVERCFNVHLMYIAFKRYWIDVKIT